jgi:1,4-dihydroxy-6-naphthoate synthase
VSIKIGISPCPNDTFIFEAIYNKRIDLQGLEFDFILEDVEYLNKAAIKGEIEVTKLSYFAFSKITENYQILNSGGALGSNCGPLLVSAQSGYIPDAKSKVAIPGINTTANFLLSLAWPDVQNKHEVMFSSIEESVLSGEYNLGLIIHESRFTYASKGLIKVMDLGMFWEERTKSPIPLGCIAVKRNLSNDLKKKIDTIVRSSVQYAFEHPQDSKQFIKSHSQELSDEVISAHIELYVNDYSINLGTKGRQGVNTFFAELINNNYIRHFDNSIYID